MPEFLDPAAIPVPFSTSEKSGFYAELHAHGGVRHFAYYVDGKPRGWVVEIAEDGAHAAARKEIAVSFSEADDADSLIEWLDKILVEVYREPEHGALVHCSFCGKSQGEVERLIAGPFAYICNECVGVCKDILES